MSKKIKLFCFGFGQVEKHFIKDLISKEYEFDFVVTKYHLKYPTFKEGLDMIKNHIV